MWSATAASWETMRRERAYRRRAPAVWAGYPVPVRAGLDAGRIGKATTVDDAVAAVGKFIELMYHSFGINRR